MGTYVGRKIRILLTNTYETATVFVSLDGKVDISANQVVLETPGDAVSAGNHDSGACAMVERETVSERATGNSPKHFGTTPLSSSSST